MGIGIIGLQVRNHPEIIPQLMARLMNYLSSYPEMSSYKGKLILVEANPVRNSSGALFLTG